MLPSDVPAIWQYARALFSTRRPRALPGSWEPASAKRRFEAAKSDRLTFSWSGTHASMDGEIRMDLAVLRARSRELAINNDYFAKFLQMVGSHVVGPSGFTLQSQVADNNGKPDTLARRAIEASFWEWSRAGNCDTSGRLSFAEVCRLFIRTVARDGEALARRVRNSRFAHGYKLQLIDIDRLDIHHNEALANGNMVRMGIELDGYGSPVAYHLMTRHPGEYMAAPAGSITHERVPASDIIHAFLAERPEQNRGFPWAAQSMLRLNMLRGYEEAAIVAARVGAAKMGFFVAPNGDTSDLADDKDAEGHFITDAEAGVFQTLPQGYDFKPFSPDYPTQNYDPFIKACLRGIASGLGVAYNTLANDLEGVNFSSIRSGVLEERDNWMVLQNWMIDVFLRPVFADWLEAALLKGVILMPNGSALPAGKLFKFGAHTWQGRRWAWVDPEKDIAASILAIRSGLSTPQIVAAQMGLDIEDVIDALNQANAMAEAAKLPAYCAAAPAPVPAQDPATAKALADIAERLGRIEASSERNITIHPPAVSVNLPEHLVAMENHVSLPEVNVKAGDVTVKGAEAAPQVSTEEIIERDANCEITRIIRRVVPETLQTR